MRAIDLTGKRFDRWIVEAKADKRRWTCVCDCGRRKDVEGSNLTMGRSRSCGCLSVEITKKNCTTHGYTVGGAITREYRTWAKMKERCYNPNEKRYADYGGRGISVCDEWREDFLAFLRHIGPKPEGRYSIDRIDVNGNYEPGNVRWATDVQQSRNRRNVPTVGGVDVPSVRDDNGVSRTTYHRRVRAGISPAIAATTTPRAKRPNGTGRARG